MFCLRCGNPTAPPRKQVTVSAEADDGGSEMFAMLCMGLAFMMFFFSLAPFFMGIWIAGVGMLVVGVVLMVAGYSMIRSSKKDHLAILERKAVKVRCRYCGSLNNESSNRCHSCGASL